ncbi:MAG TPA: glycoside hydrolase family 9 protein [Lachnospiraceae bacterium]|nr:glycoside hydrolase family 9 protein [Lachnospiraceae bacterium]
MLLKKNKRKIWLALLLATLILEGCSTTGSNQKNQMQVKPVQNDSITCLEAEPILDYVVPTVMPSILVNQMGYEVGTVKIALVTGERLPTQFHLVDSETEDIVFTGNLKLKNFDTDTRIYTGYADFSAFSEEGSYYIECDIVGRSYGFSIQKDIYQELMTECIKSLEKGRGNLTKEDMIQVCDSLSVLLLSYELYGTVYDRQIQESHLPKLMEEVKLYVEQLIGFQDMTTGAVMNGETPLYEETAWLAAVLAKFSYSYQKFDSVYANACLQASDKAWKYLEKKDTDMEDSLLFYGAAELYRATGKYMYHASVKTLGANIPRIQVDEAQTFGTLTYASTKRKVDVDLCGSLLSVLLNRAEMIAEQAQQNVFGIGCSIQEESLEEILWDAVIMSSMDYVITNNEYATIIQNFQNYIAGENESAENYIQFQEDTQANLGDRKEENRNKIGSDYMNTARYIMILSEIMSHEQEE